MSWSNVRPAGMSSDEDEDELFGYESSGVRNKAPRPEPVFMPPINSQKISNEINSFLSKDRLISLFHEAVNASDVEALTKLIEQGVSPNCTLPHEWTPLMNACAAGQAPTVQFLLDHGADPQFHKELFTPLMACCISTYASEHDRADCARLLLEHDADPNAEDKHKSTALIYAATNNLRELVEVLLAVPDINVNTQDKEGWSALFYAVNGENKEIVEMLLQAGADPHVKDVRHGDTAIDIAVSKNLLEIAEILGHTFPPPELPKVPLCPCDPLQDFFCELPNLDGSGGFSGDVKNILSGVGLDHLFDRLIVQPSMQDFLNMSDSDLSEIGVKFAPTRCKILQKGIHRFHLQPWRKSSMYRTPQGAPVEIEDLIMVTSNMLKHLTMANASFRYLKTRVEQRKNDCGLDDRVNMEFITVLADTYQESQQLHEMFRRLLNETNKMKRVGLVPADHVGPKHYSAQSKCVKCFQYVLLTSTLCGLLYYIKTKN